MKKAVLAALYIALFHKILRYIIVVRTALLWLRGNLNYTIIFKKSRKEDFYEQPCGGTP